MRNRERPEGSFLNGESGRFSSDFIIRNPFVRTTLLIGSIAAGLTAAWEASGRPSVEDARCAVVDSGLLNFDKEFYNKPIEGEEAKVFVTSAYEGSKFDFVPVREEPNQSDACGNLAGWARFGQDVVAEPYFGNEYISAGIDSHGLGKINGPDGEEGYGKWFLVRKIEVLVKDEFGNYSEKQILYNKLVSGNFLSLHPALLENSSAE